VKPKSAALYQRLAERMPIDSRADAGQEHIGFPICPKSEAGCSFKHLRISLSQRSALPRRLAELGDATGRARQILLATAMCYPRAPHAISSNASLGPSHKLGKSQPQGGCNTLHSQQRRRTLRPLDHAHIVAVKARTIR